ncbi:MAG: hypothetical protein JKY81_08125 [Colwellia sp.]|nr:hypothetical protein [Colwellia sp.]
MHPYYEDEYPVLKQLSTWFKQKSAEELTEIIISYIGESANEQSRWQLAMLNDQGGLAGADIKNMIDKALPEEGVWSWQEVSGYFEHTDNMFTEIFVAIEALSASKQWQHILYSLQRLNKVLEQIDDSGGFRFDLEGQLNQKLTALFTQQTWSDDKKAQWIFEHYKTWQYDVFPSVPDDFILTENVNELFINLCTTEAEKRSQQGVDLSVWDEKWALQRLIEPLIKQAQQKHDWQTQCRLMNMTAYKADDFIKISQLCLDENEPLEAEYWLQQAYQSVTKQVSHAMDKLSCQRFAVQLHLALKEYKQAWQLAWLLFTERPSFSGYKDLIALEQKTAVIDVDFKTKTEQVFNECYAENSAGCITNNADALLSFYLYHHQLAKARLWVKSHKANPSHLLKLADLIINEHPQEAVELYYRVVLPTVAQGNNQSYQQATDLLLSLKKALEGDDPQGTSELLNIMIGKIIKQHKAKRNMMKLLKTHFSACF